jgi:hypothetical protein
VTLPAELRNAIFEEFCIAPDVSILDKATSIKNGLPDINVLPLLQSCRQIYYEVSTIFYQGNHFAVLEIDIGDSFSHVQALMHSFVLWLHRYV